MSALMSSPLSVNDQASYESVVLTSESEFDRISDEWQSLYARSVNPEACLKYSWMREWWRIFGRKYGKAPGGLRIVTVWRNGRLAALAPLYLQIASGQIGRATLRFISSGGDASESVYPENLDMLHDGGAPSEYFSELLRIIHQLEWDELNLSILSPDALLNDINSHTISSRIWIRRTTFESPYADLTSGFSSYLSAMKSSSRSQLKRILKQTSRVNFRVAAEANEGKLWFDELTQLHQKRWRRVNQTGAFSSSKIAAFHHALIDDLLPKGEVFISRLADEDCPICIIYGFVSGDKFDFYQSGVELSTDKIRSPGILGHLLSMQHLSSGGIKTYDFLSGASAYKLRLASRVNKCAGLAIIKPTLRSAISLTMFSCRRFAAKLRLRRS